ncbi:MAG: carboxypeptidase-like regulatory domain-containing protein, partial [Planctomycetota bacterium]|nr:carboxypeptidase-like regulatory domain-containing protein [Planctomycetota bacterium]
DLKATVQMASDRRYFRIDPSVLRVNDDGTYEAKSVPAGKAYIMWFEADNFGNGEVSLWPGQVQAGRVALPDVKLPPAALTVSGIVVSAAGKPLASQTVAVSGRRQRSHNTITDKDGRFVLTQIIDEVISLDAYGSTSGSVLARGGRYGRHDRRGAESGIAPARASTGGQGPAGRRGVRVEGRPRQGRGQTAACVLLRRRGQALATGDANTHRESRRA